MENPWKIIMFGDSITKGCTEIFREAITREYKEVELTVINAGIDGETSTDGLARLQNILSQHSNVVVIGFGMNDWRKGVDKETFGKNLRTMIDMLENNGVHVVLMTIIPDYQGFRKGTSAEISEYNAVMYNIAEEKRVRIADGNALWKHEIKPVWIGLGDQIHPNRKGHELICKALMRVVPRRTTTVLWGYNGAAAPCNYKCPYCSDHGLRPKKHYFKGSLDQWQAAFKNAFSNQHLVFYISYGEPMLGKLFYEVTGMIATEPNWEMMMTSNLSQPLDRLVKTRLAREGRLNINASFHPTETTIDEFLKKLLFLREHGIKCPVIYVMYPPLMDEFENYFRTFNGHNFLVHVRAFEGEYNGKKYPRDYAERERRFIAKYADNATIKYMLNRPTTWAWGKLAYHGMYYIFVTNEGDVGTEYYSGRKLGNILEGTLKLDIEPQPIQQGIERAVSDVAAVLETGYHELQGDYVISFAEQGGVYHTDDGVHYPHLQTDFGNRKIRKEYNFPTRIDKLKWNLPHLIHGGKKILHSKIHRLL